MLLYFQHYFKNQQSLTSEIIIFQKLLYPKNDCYLENPRIPK